MTVQGMIEAYLAGCSIELAACYSHVSCMPVAAHRVPSDGRIWCQQCLWCQSQQPLLLTVLSTLVCKHLQPAGMAWISPQQVVVEVAGIGWVGIGAVIIGASSRPACPTAYGMHSIDPAINRSAGRRSEVCGKWAWECTWQTYSHSKEWCRLLLPVPRVQVVSWQ